MSESAIRQLGKLDLSAARMILKWLKKNVDGCENPRAHGKSLKGNLSQYWRYRVGDYRILCTIDDGRLVVQTIRIGHRSAVYDE